MEVIFLGTGTSHGVPMIGCNCKSCISENLYNKRKRSSVFIKVKTNEKKVCLLIDTPQELRLQLLENKIDKFDGILYTHPHADHLLGFDDIRAINRTTDKQIPCFGNEYTIKEIKRVFPYIDNAIQKGGGLPEVIFNIIDKKFLFQGLNIYPLSVKHGKLNILGYRIKDFAYITDCSLIPESTFSLLSDLKVLVLGVLRHKKHTTHMNIEKALQVIKKLNVHRVYFTHLSHDLEHKVTNKILPDHINLAYDGLSIKWND